jgi:hypothetical protein
VKEASRSKKGRLRRALSDSDEDGRSQRRRFEGEDALADSDMEMDSARTLEDSDADEKIAQSGVKRRAKQSRLAESDSD